MRIKILAVEIKHVKEGKKDYKLMDVSYKNLDFQGKVEGKKVVSFASPDVFNALKDAVPGDEFDVTKGDKTASGHVPWTRCIGITEGETVSGTGVANTSSAQSVSANRSTPKSTYETPEERAKKQHFIIKQSSLSNAIAFFSANEGNFGVDDVLKVATQFEHYVHGIDPVKELLEMESDIPY